MLVLYERGQRLFGESRAQDLKAKCDLMPADVEWHFIGHLQTNKVAAIIDKVSMIHSVDSLHLATEINERARKIDRVMPVLLQVNTTQEAGKYGIEPQALPGLVDRVAALTNIKVDGLMTIGPNTEKGPKIRRAFQLLRVLFQEVGRVHYVGWKYLSMGMSHDYEIAIEEGANIVRIGSALFGQRRTA